MFGYFMQKTVKFYKNVITELIGSIWLLDKQGLKEQKLLLLVGGFFLKYFYTFFYFLPLKSSF